MSIRRLLNTNPEASRRERGQLLYKGSRLLPRKREFFPFHFMRPASIDQSIQLVFLVILSHEIMAIQHRFFDRWSFRGYAARCPGKMPGNARPPFNRIRTFTTTPHRRFWKHDDGLRCVLVHFEHVCLLVFFYIPEFSPAKRHGHGIDSIHARCYRDTL